MSHDHIKSVLGFFYPNDTTSATINSVVVVCQSCFFVFCVFVMDVLHINFVLGLFVSSVVGHAFSRSWMYVILTGKLFTRVSAF